MSERGREQQGRVKGRKTKGVRREREGKSVGEMAKKNKRGYREGKIREKLEQLKDEERERERE